MFGNQLWEKIEEVWKMYGRRVHARACERRRVAVVLVFTVCLVIILAVAFGSFLSKAEQKKASADTFYKYYTNIEVQPGDTLWTLADAYLDENYASKDAYIQEVCELNSLGSDGRIVSGEFLLMPYYSTEYK